MIESSFVSLSDQGEKESVSPGWYRIADSTDVTDAALISITFADVKLVAYRDREGLAHIASALCPHNGVDLNCTNAPIKQGVIACPLHGWNFDTASGACTLIPYNPKIVPKIRLKEYAAHETGGALMLWWDDAGGEPSSPPPAA